jgi:hypothetical protein
VNIIDWIAAGLLGAVVGASELVSRYRDAPGAALKTWPAWGYVAINIAASLGAFGLIQTNGWLAQQSEWMRVLVAGVSAMAFFRTSVFTVRAGDRDIGVGPSGFLQIFLSAADRSVDRQRATARSDAVAKAMQGVAYEKAHLALPLYCLALMQSVSAEDQQQLESSGSAAQSDRRIQREGAIAWA